MHAEYGSGPIMPSGEDTNIDLDALSSDMVQHIFDIVTEHRAALCLPSFTGKIDVSINSMHLHELLKAPFGFQVVLF